MKTTIRFRASAKALQDALHIVSLVPPRPITATGGCGFLFVVRGDLCFLYSRDSLRVARATFPIQDVEGEGMFIYPAENIGLLERAGDGMLSFTASSEEDVHQVQFSAESGATASRTSYDPRLLATCDKDLDAAVAGHSFPVGLLKEAFREAKPFLPGDDDKRAEDHYRGIQIFDASKPEWAKGDGTLFAATGVVAFYFFCEAFIGKGLAIHGQHLGSLTSFLGKSTGSVEIKRGTNMTFAINSQGHVLGWVHHDKTHAKFSTYGLSNDQFVFDVPVGAAVSALKYMSAGLGNKRSKIKVSFTGSEPQIVFSAIEGSSETKSFPVPVVPHEGSKVEDLTFYCNINHLMPVIADAKGDRVMLRIAVRAKDASRPKDTAMVRTIDTFLLDGDGKIVPGSADTKPEGAYSCMVTRFVPSTE